MIPTDITAVCQYDIVGLVYGDLYKGLHGLEGLHVRFHEIACMDAGNAEGVVESCADHEIDTHGPGDLQGLLVAGVPFENEIGRVRVFEEIDAVKFLNGFCIGQSGTDRLSSPRYSRHEVAFHEACDYLYVGVIESLIQIYVRVSGGVGGQNLR